MLNPRMLGSWQLSWIQDCPVFLFKRYNPNGRMFPDLKFRDTFEHQPISLSNCTMLRCPGQVIGINTAIHADGEGIGFAIPINSSLKIAASLVENGCPPAHAYLGIQMETLTSDLVQRYNADPDSGALHVPRLGQQVSRVRCLPSLADRGSIHIL